MTFPTSLLPEARSTYRSILRAARLTFSGDIIRRAALENAARATFQSPTLTPPSKGAFASGTNGQGGSRRVGLPSAKEIAAMKSTGAGARKEVDMEMKTDKEPPAPESGGNADELIKRLGEWKEVAAFLRRNVVQGRMDENGTYRLRLTKDTELNNNLDNSASNAPKSPRPKRDPSRKCGDTPPEAPAFW